MLPDGAGGLYLIGPNQTWRQAKGAERPVLLAERGSGAGAAALSPDGVLHLGVGPVVIRIAADGAVTRVADGFGDAFGIAFDRKGRLLVADWDRGEVVRMEADGRKVLARGLEYPSGLAVDGEGRIYVKESGRQVHTDMRIQRIAEDGTLTLFATVPSVSRFD